QIRRHGEHFMRELSRVGREFETLRLDRERLLEPASNWEQLARATNAALGLELKDLSRALADNARSENPQAREDRAYLRSRLSELIAEGTIKRTASERVLSNVTSLTEKLATKLARRPQPVEESPAVAIMAS